MNQEKYIGRVIGLKRKLKKNRKFIVLAFIFLLLPLSMFLYYRFFIEASYSSDYDTIGTTNNREGVELNWKEN